MILLAHFAVSRDGDLDFDVDCHLICLLGRVTSMKNCREMVEFWFFFAFLGKIANWRQCYLAVNYSLHVRLTTFYLLILCTKHPHPSINLTLKQHHSSFWPANGAQLYWHRQAHLLLNAINHFKFEIQFLPSPSSFSWIFSTSTSFHHEHCYLTSHQHH